MTVIALQNDTRLDDLKKFVRDQGANEGAGAEALPLTALRLVRAAADGVIEPDDASMLYEEYLKGKSRKQVHEHTANGKGANTSKMRNIIALGCLPHVDGVALLDRVVDVRAEMKARDEKPLGAYKAMVEAAKAQLKQPTVELSDDQVRAACTNPESNKGLIDKLIAQYKATVKLAEECGGSANMARVVDGLREEIVEQGGEIPPTTKEDKKRAAFLKQAQALGFALTPAV